MNLVTYSEVLDNRPKVEPQSKTCDMPLASGGVHSRRGRARVFQHQRSHTIVSTGCVRPRQRQRQRILVSPTVIRGRRVRGRGAEGAFVLHSVRGVPHVPYQGRLPHIEPAILSPRSPRLVSALETYNYVDPLSNFVR